MSHTTTDYKSDVKITWCPGCGDFAVLNALYQALTTLDLDPKDVVVVSGIGCSGRLPIFVNSYGFHGVHGRVLPTAMGVKIGNPKLTVIAVGGDGDGLAIGGGHFPHAARRNIDITYIMLDNNIYGLTKGQASPTSTPQFKRERGLAGPDERPINPVLLLISSGCGFVARTHAGNLPHLRSMFKQAIEYPGFAFVHILAGCVTYQGPSYGKQIYDRCFLLPADHDSSDFNRACDLARGEKFALGVLYRREPGARPAAAGPDLAEEVGIWPSVGAPGEVTFPGDAS